MSGLFGLKWLTPELIAMGGLAAATGGAALPGLLAAAPAAAGAAALPAAAEVAAAAAPVVAASAPAAAVPAEAGLLGSAKALGTQAMGYLDSANKVLKPVGQAANAAGAVQGMFPQQQPIQTPAPHFGNGAGSQAFSGLLQDSMATDQMRAQEDMQRRQAQQKLIGLIGGGYGRTS